MFSFLYISKIIKSSFQNFSTEYLPLKEHTRNIIIYQENVNTEHDHFGDVKVQLVSPYS